MSHEKVFCLQSVLHKVCNAFIKVRYIQCWLSAVQLLLIWPWIYVDNLQSFHRLPQVLFPSASDCAGHRGKLIYTYNLYSLLWWYLLKLCNFLVWVIVLGPKSLRSSVWIHSFVYKKCFILIFSKMLKRQMQNEEDDDWSKITLKVFKYLLNKMWSCNCHRIVNSVLIMSAGAFLFLSNMTCQPPFCARRH